MQLVITALPGRVAKLKVEKQKADGTTVGLFASKFNDHADYAKASKVLGVKADVLLDFIENKYRKTAVSTLSLVAARVATAFSVRNEVGSGTESFTDFDDALRGVGSVIEWGGTEQTCCLDVDFHGVDPDTFALLMLCETIRPAPLYFWASRGGGAHLMYFASEKHTADELAAVAAYTLAIRFPLATFEFLHRTRKPPGAYQTRPADNDAGAVRRLLGQYTEGDFTDWLEQKGYTGNDRFPHNMCPVAPELADRAMGNTNPVVLRPGYIHCYICEADGRCFGTSKPGHFPLSALAGERTSSAVASCVKNLVHWGHARYILASQIPHEHLAARVYRALLKLVFADDPRIPAVFEVCKENGLVRYDGYWCDNTGTVLTLDKGSAILRTLPHCQYVNASGEVETDAATVEYLAQCIDHSTRGYTPLYPIRGLQITQFQELPQTKVYTVLQVKALAPDNMAHRRPKYVPKSQRMELPDAWKVIDKALPGIDTALVELLLIGRGCVEHRAGLPPMLFLTGNTGSGKTGHVHVAASIAGDLLTGVPYIRDPDRLRQAVLAGKQSGAFVFFDEFFKNARIAKATNVEAIETMLSITPDSVSHQLYIGQVRMGDLPLLIWADTHIPLAVQQHEQIGRRMFTHRLPGTVHWEAPLAAAGIAEPSKLREFGSADMIAACDAVLSYVMDAHFASPVTDFAQAAAGLGFKRLREGGAIEDKRQLIRELYEAVCNAPDADANTQQRKGKRCKLVIPDPSDAVYAALDAMWDDEEKRQPVCRMIDETDLRAVLGLKAAAAVEMKKHGNRLTIRFVSLDDKLINEELRA